MMAETTSSHDEPEPVMQSSFLTDKRGILFIYIPVWLFFTMTFGMFFEERSGMSQAVNLISIIGLNIFEFAWCRIDSRERSYQLHRFFSYGIVIFGFLSVIYYLFRSRGFRGGLVAVAWMLIYTVLLILTVAIVSGISLVFLVMIGLAPPGILD